MGNLTDNVPKPMLQIKGKPILAYKLEALPKEIDEVIFVIGYLGKQIRDFFGYSYAGRKISYVEQTSLNGSGGALVLAKEMLEKDFLVMNGDDLYMREDLEKMMQHNLAMLVTELENPTQFGVVSVNENGELSGILERKNVVGKAFVNTGLYKLNKKFFEFELVAIGNGEFGLPQTLVAMTDNCKVTIEKAKAWFPIGNPDDLKKDENIIDKFI